MTMATRWMPQLVRFPSAILVACLALSCYHSGLTTVVAADTPSFGKEVDLIVSAWCRDSIRIRAVPVVSGGDSTGHDRTNGFYWNSTTNHKGALVEDHCDETITVGRLLGDISSHIFFENGNLRMEKQEDKEGQLLLSFKNIKSDSILFEARINVEPSSIEPGYWRFHVKTTPGNNNTSKERVYGLGQGGWTSAGGSDESWCATGPSEHVVPLLRNGQANISLLQTKFDVTIPFAYSSKGYGFLFNMPGYGSVSVGKQGGMDWTADAAPMLDFWVTTTPSCSSNNSNGNMAGEAIYERYADATGHAPVMRPDALLFWQSRLRYMTSDMALDVARKYHDLDVPVGVLVIDYHNMKVDGDFQPDPACFPSLQDLSDGIAQLINATVMFSIWPEAKNNSESYETLRTNDCLFNPDLDGLVMNPTTANCRRLIWKTYVQPNYFDQGISTFWLDETDAEGTSGNRNDGDFGYNTSYGPASVTSNLWVNDWLRLFTEFVDSPLVLTRGAWAGGQRYGIVLWSSDVESTFEELTAQVPLGIHASLSGIPWWTSDVGGFGCGSLQPNDSPYMRELIVRWYQFGVFCPIFRTHGMRNGTVEPRPSPDPCAHDGSTSRGGNEIWSYGEETQAILSKYVKLRKALLPYLQALAEEVSKRGVPTMRPLWWHFPNDDREDKIWEINDQYFLGPDLMVAPVTIRGARSRQVYFPSGDVWINFWNNSDTIQGGAWKTIAVPLDTIAVYRRSKSSYWHRLDESSILAQI